MRTARRNVKGFTLIELLIVVAIIAILAAITIPSLIRARISANEASAIGSLRALMSGQSTFATSCGGGGWAGSFDALRTAPPGGQPFIGPDLSAANLAPGKSGYYVDNTTAGPVVWPAAKTCNMVDDSVSNFVITSTPLSVGVTGVRSFGMTGQGTIYQDNSGVQMTAPFVVGGSVTMLQ